MADFEPVGDDADLSEAYRRSQAGDSAAAGWASLAQAKALLRTRPRPKGVRRAEGLARGALTAFARALNWSEEQPEESAAHSELDDAGRWVRETFGCSLRWTGDAYVQACPVALAHNRIGLSVGGVAGRRTCSLCGDDASECLHEKGTAYLVPGGAGDLGWCRVCLAKDGCDHDPDQTYRAPVVHVLSDMRLDEVSLVARPAHPDARVAELTFSLEEVREGVGEALEPGGRVSCDRCVLPCEGLTRHDLRHV